MPELPEVETVMRGLRAALEGHRIVRAAAHRPDLRWPIPPGLGRRLTGARVLGFRRRGKYILAPLDRGETLIIHLGMTGRLEIEDSRRARTAGVLARASAPNPKHAHVLFETETGARVTYFDARRFGFMDLVRSEDLAEHPRFASMGPEPLEAEFSAAYLARAFKARGQGAKTLLLDQTIVAGLGNIYVSEALHRAGVSPLRAAGTLAKPRLVAIVAAVRAVLRDAIAAGGSTLRDYANAQGAAGYFQHAFQVYGREGQPCLASPCTAVIRRVVQAGRSTFYCPRCQK